MNHNDQYLFYNNTNHCIKLLERILNTNKNHSRMTLLDSWQEIITFHDRIIFFLSKLTSIFLQIDI